MIMFAQSVIALHPAMLTVKVLAVLVVVVTSSAAYLGSVFRFRLCSL